MASRALPTNVGVPRCDRCGDPVNLRGNGLAYQQVIGWAPQRQRGGANAVRLPKATGKWMCRTCVDFLSLKRAETLELFPREPGA